MDEAEAGISPELIDVVRYALIAAMLVVARKRLRVFRIDKLSVASFVVFGAILRIPASSGETATQPTFWLFSVIAFPLAAVLFRTRSTEDRWEGVNWGWIGLALLSAPLPIVGVAAIAGLVTGIPTTIAPTAPLTLPALNYLFVYWMGHAAVLEEPAFRGFLWGFLEQHRWRGVHIWLLQAALFWLGHLRYFSNPFLFWVTVPLGGLLLGWLSWHSKSIAPSVVAHAAYNTLIAFL